MLEENEVFEIIEHTLKENPEYKLSAFDKEKVADIYYKAMNENVNKNKTLDEQESLITQIISGRNIQGREPESWDRIYNDLSDTRHLNYYDVFLENGERDKIIKALNNNGLPTSILQGIKLNQNVDFTKNGITVKQVMGETDFGSPVIVEFYIEYKGKRIYEFSREPNNARIEIKGSLDDYIQRLYDLTDIFSDNQKTIKRKTSFTQKGKVIEEVYVSKKENVVIRKQGYYTDKNGKRRFGFIKGGGIV